MISSPVSASRRQRNKTHATNGHRKHFPVIFVERGVGVVQGQVQLRRDGPCLAQAVRGTEHNAILIVAAGRQECRIDVVNSGIRS